MTVIIIESEEDALASFPIMKVLRPHLEINQFQEQLSRQRQQGYRLAALVDDNEEISALAGFRFAEFMAWGKVLYLDDLITDPAKLKNGYAGALLEERLGNNQPPFLERFKSLNHQCETPSIFLKA